MSSEALTYLKEKVPDAPKPKAKKKKPTGMALYRQRLMSKGYDGKDLGPHMDKISGMVKAGKPESEIHQYINGLPRK